MKTKEEIEILRADAFAGDAGAQNDLGCAYSSGDGVIKNQKEAFMWFERSGNKVINMANIILDVTTITELA